MTVVPAGPRRAGVDRLLRRVETGYLDMLDADVDREFGPDGAMFRAAGFVRPAAPRSSAPCPGCEGEPLRVTTVPRRVGGGTTFVACRRCGPTAIEAAALRQSRIDVGRFVAAVARAAGAAHGAAAAVTPNIWHLGQLPSVVRAKEAYLAVQVGPEERSSTVALLARRPKAILFIPTPTALAEWAAGPPEVVLPLSNFLAVADQGLAFDTEAFAVAVLNTCPPPGKRPAPHGGIRLKQIKDLKAELARHIRAARDHAYRSRDLTGTPALLPRPTRKELGARVGLDPSQTTRCFKHPDGEELKEMYRKSAILDWVMARPP